MTARTKRDDPETNTAHAKLCAEVSPHLRRSFDFYRSTAARDAIGQNGSSILDDYEVGVMVVSDDAAPHTISKCAERMIARGKVVRLKGGKIRMADENADMVLQGMTKPTFVGSKIASYISNGARVTVIIVEKDSVAASFRGRPWCFSLSRFKSWEVGSKFPWQRRCSG